jgi:WD40 repeat protein
MNDSLRCFALLLVFSFTLPAASESSCPAIAIPQPAPGADMFNAQQEAVLGDAIASGVRQDMRIVSDPALTQPLLAVASRLEAQLPAGHPKFTVILYDSTGADAFSIPGHVYISRKLVALTHSEDELAGVVAHEIGHILAHHSAMTVTEAFRRVLKINQVGDNEDITARWNDFLSNARRVKYTEVDAERSAKAERQHQDQADSIALSVVTRAGYSPQAFADIFDRIAETQGKTGSFWSDLFGETKPDSKRLRQLVKDRPPLPADCIMAHGATIPDYAAWRSKVIEQSSTAQAVNVAGLISKQEVTERLRPVVSHIRISPDGKYVLAQDDANIFVLTRSPLKSIFRIDAPDAQFAHFTPDSTGIVFHIAASGSSPRVERWDIASQKRTEVHEIYVRRGCLVSAITPDARTLACLTAAGNDVGLSFDFDLYDTASGVSFYQKKDWVAVNAMRLDFSTLWQIFFALSNSSQELFDKFMRIAISADGRYLVAHSPENVVAFDLTTRQPVNLPGSIKDLLSFGRFIFLSDGSFMGVGGSGGDLAKIVEFPSGRAIQSSILIGGSRISPVARGPYVMLRPIKDNALGIVDLKQNKIFFQSQRSAFDIWDMQGIGERENGDLVVVDLVTAKFQETAKLPEAQLGGVRAGAVSPDLTWLAVSQSSRGAIWNVPSGKRTYHMRGFRGGYFAPDGEAILDFPKYMKTERSIVDVSLDHNSLQAKYTIDEKERSAQAGKYLITVDTADSGGAQLRNVTFNIKDVNNGKVLWSKHIANEAPTYFLDAPNNSLMLMWPANSKEVQSLAKQDADAAAKLSPFKSKDGIDYVQVLDLDTGKQRFALAVDTGKNSIRVADIIASTDRLIFADRSNRLLIYSTSGAQLATFPGNRPEVSRAANLLAAHTQSGEVTLYDLQTLQPRATHTFDSRAAYVGFSADGKRMLVLSGDQVIYLIDTAATR